ncbi:MAG: hypothetical protein ACTHOL_13140 [Luteibacter jiangsuensis]
MKHMVFCLGMLAATFTASASPPHDDMRTLVDRLVDDTTKDSASEARAFDRLMHLGSAAVPYIVARLGDGQRLPEQSIWVRRHGHEDRQYQPWYVHDGLEAVLNELTGVTMGPQNGHLLKSQREKNTRKWVAWCVQRYPMKADVCRSGRTSDRK